MKNNKRDLERKMVEKILKIWHPLEEYDMIVGCLTCNLVFLTPNYQPETLWYILAAEHWLQNPTHEVIFYEHERTRNNKPRIICWSVGWRQRGPWSVLKEIQHLKNLEKRVPPNE